MRERGKNSIFDEVFEDIANPEEIGLMGVSAKTPEDEYVVSETKNEVRKLVGSLRPGYRDAMEAFYFEGKSIKVISKETGIPEGTLKVRLLRGRESFKEKWGK